MECNPRWRSKWPSFGNIVISRHETIKTIRLKFKKKMFLIQEVHTCHIQYRNKVTWRPRRGRWCPLSVKISAFSYKKLWFFLSFCYLPTLFCFLTSHLSWSWRHTVGPCYVNFWAHRRTLRSKYVTRICRLHVTRVSSHEASSALKLPRFYWPSWKVESYSFQQGQ